MKKVIESKFVDFIENTIDYKLAKNRVDSNYAEDYNGEFDLTPSQYACPNKIARWFVELETGSKHSDDFCIKLFNIFKKNQELPKPHLTIVDDITELVKNTTITDRENGHLFRFIWYFYEGRPFGDKVHFSTSEDVAYPYSDPDSISNIGKSLLSFVKEYDRLKEKLNLFRSEIYKKYDTLYEFYKKQKKNNIIGASGITLALLKKLIKNSTLHQDIKDEILENFKDGYQELDEIIEGGLIVHLDTLIDCIGDNTQACIAHFKANLKSFPVSIMTEDDVVVYEP